jgi:hypothetical protein
MKKLLFYMLLFTSFIAFSQTDIIETQMVNADVVTVEGDKFNVVANRMSIDNISNTIEYAGVSSFETESIQVCDADKIVYNSGTNEIFVSGNSVIKGVSLHMNLPMEGMSKHIRYKLGDKVAYME